MKSIPFTELGVPVGRRPKDAHDAVFMDLALDAARKAAARGETPVGAALSDRANGCAFVAGNAVETDWDGSAHAELRVMRAAARARRSRHLADTVLYVTLEPCVMCAAAVGLFRVPRLVFGAYDPKGGAVEHGPRLFENPDTPHKPAHWIGGLRERECGTLLRDFFADLRSGRGA